MFLNAAVNAAVARVIASKNISYPLPDYVYEFFIFILIIASPWLVIYTFKSILRK